MKVLAAFGMTPVLFASDATLLNSPAFFNKTQNMRQLFIFVLVLANSRASLSQCESLHFIELGSHAAYCRTAAYQSGNGVVYAAVAGGTPDYVYLWTNINTGQETSNNVLGGVNPGEYHIKVIDDAGCVLTATVKVDSILPTADFDVLSVVTNTDFLGLATAEVIIKNTSKHHDWPEMNMIWFDDTANYIKVDVGNWEMIEFNEQRTFEFDDISFHEICVATTNKNGCTDTICKSITVTEPIETSPGVNIMTSSVSGEFTVELLLSYAVELTLYDLSGIEVWSQPVLPGFNTFTISPGQYIYEIVDPVTNLLLGSGTFFVL